MPYSYELGLNALREQHRAMGVNCDEPYWYIASVLFSGDSVRRKEYRWAGWSVVGLYQLQFDLPKHNPIGEENMHDYYVLQGDDVKPESQTKLAGEVFPPFAQKR